MLSRLRAAGSPEIRTFGSPVITYPPQPHWSKYRAAGTPEMITCLSQGMVALLGGDPWQLVLSVILAALLMAFFSRHKQKISRNRGNEKK
jgi:hypothetical protein